MSQFRGSSSSIPSIARSKMAPSSSVPEILPLWVSKKYLLGSSVSNAGWNPSPPKSLGQSFILFKLPPVEPLSCAPP